MSDEQGGPAAGGRAAVAWGLDEVAPAPSVVTIGNFDGVHRGHQTLLTRTTSAAEDAGIRSVVVTFDPHPAAVVRPGSEPPALQRTEERVAALLAAGTDLVVVLPFTRELSALSPREFVQQVLVDRLEARRVIVGANFRFGHRASGDVVVLNDTGAEFGFETEAVTLLELDGVPISSTAVREHLAAGDLSWANRALGRPYRLKGKVVPGDGRGRTIGVPTANVAVPSELVVPANGVYAGHVVVDGATLPCVTNVGVRPTFGAGSPPTVEAHVLDAELELYGRTLEVTFEHRIRDEQRFDGVDALVTQIRADIDTARDLLVG